MKGDIHSGIGVDYALEKKGRSTRLDRLIDLMSVEEVKKKNGSIKPDINLHHIIKDDTKLKIIDKYDSLFNKTENVSYRNLSIEADDFIKNIILKYALLVKEEYGHERPNNRIKRIWEFTKLIPSFHNIEDKDNLIMLHNLVSFYLKTYKKFKEVKKDYYEEKLGFFPFELYDLKKEREEQRIILSYFPAKVSKNLILLVDVLSENLSRVDKEKGYSKFLNNEIEFGLGLNQKIFDDFDSEEVQTKLSIPFYRQYLVINDLIREVPRLNYKMENIREYFNYRLKSEVPREKDYNDESKEFKLKLKKCYSMVKYLIREFPRYIKNEFKSEKAYGKEDVAQLLEPHIDEILMKAKLL